VLGSADGDGEIVVIQDGVDDFVAVLSEEHRFNAAWCGVPTSEEEDFHNES
jgi:hypothetical protein